MTRRPLGGYESRGRSFPLSSVTLPLCEAADDGGAVGREIAEVVFEGPNRKLSKALGLARSHRHSDKGATRKWRRVDPLHFR